MSERVYSYDATFAAMCMMEEIADPQLKDAPTPWDAYREQWGVNGLRDKIIVNLAQPCDDAWQRAYSRYEQATDSFPGLDKEFPGMPDDPGSFDYEFVPFWMRTCVDWTDLENGPRVRGT